MQRFAVIGLGSFGRHLARALTQAGDEVIGIDSDPGVVEQLRSDVALAVCMDSTDREALMSQGIHKVDAVIISIGRDFEASALTVALLKELGLARVVARADRDIQATILTRVGATAIVSPERESALRWVHRLTMPDLKQYVELGPEHSLVYLPAPEAFWNQTPNQLDLRATHGVNLIAIRRSPSSGDAEDDEIVDGGILVPTRDTKIVEGDILVVVGTNDDLSRLASA